MKQVMTPSPSRLTRLLRRLIDDRAMLETPQVKHPHATISTTADKHVHAAGAEADVVDLLVMSDELRLGRQRRNVPDRAGGVDARGDDEFGREHVPVERGQRCRVLG